MAYRQYLNDRQFRKALKTGDARGRWITDDQWKVVLREVWKQGGRVYGQVTGKADNGYYVDLLGERAFMYFSEAHPDTDDFFNQKLVFEIKHFETTQIRGRARTNIIVTNRIYE
jgi:ribosomal protein S1